MSAEYVRRYYGVDYKRGDRVLVDGNPGVIVSFPGQYLGVRFDKFPKQTFLAHPTWNVARLPRPVDCTPTVKDLERACCRLCGEPGGDCPYVCC